MSTIAARWEYFLAKTVTRPSARMPLDLEMELVCDDGGFQALRPFWDDLVDQCETATPFLRYEWMSLWWQQFQKNYSLAIVVVRNERGEPQAIAPMMMGRGMRGREHLRELGFIGGFGPAQGERFDFIVPRGREAGLTPLLCAAFKSLRSEWDTVHLAKVPEESPNLPHILFALSSCADGAGILNRHPCHHILLPRSWEDYENSQSSQWRSKFRRRWKAMLNVHSAVLGFGGADVPLPDAMRDLHDLHEINWPGGTSLFTAPEAWQFHEKLAARWVPQGRIVLLTVTIGGKAAAVIHGFIERDEFFQFQHGWDPEHSKISLGKLAMHAAIQHAIQRRLRIYDMLPGEFDYKRQLCKDVRHVVDVEAFNPLSLRAQLFRSLRGVKRLVPEHMSGRGRTTTVAGATSCSD